MFKKYLNHHLDIQKQFPEYDFKFWSQNDKIEGIAIVPICGRFILIEHK